MRFITPTGYYPYYLAAIVVGFFPAVALAYTLTGDGCFERESGLIRLTEPTCTMTITTEETATVDLQFENVDPDSVEITSDDITLTTTRTSSQLETSFTLAGEATVTVAPWVEVGDDLWFVALSDNQAAGTVETNPIFEDMLPLISAVNPVFMTNAGDLIQGSSDDETVRDMFTAVLETLEDTTVPMFPTPGNHDHNSDLGIYESYFGTADYSYEYGPAKLIALSSSGVTSRGTVTVTQRDWLSTELSTDLQTLVYFHHALSVPSWGKSTCCFEDTTERDDLAVTLETGGVDQVINGHSQGYDWRWLTAADVSTLVSGFYQLISGGGGGNIAQPDGDYHFTLVHVTPAEITHQVFELGDTNIVVDENKIGDEVTVEYDGAADLPYLRLKFKLDETVPEYLIYDDTGRYLSHQSHTYENYAVHFADVSVVKGATTFTAIPATTLHAGVSQTVGTTGYITFGTNPATTTDDTGIQVVTNTLTTTISELAQTTAGYSWVEVPASRSVDTTYTLANLPSQAEVQVYVNNVLSARGLSDTTGAFSFTASKNQNQRAVTVVIRSGLSSIVTVPTDSGTAHVRTFSLSGTNTGNFFAANNRAGEFALYTSPLGLAVIELATERLLLHDAAGAKLDTVSSTGATHSTTNRLLVEQGKSLRTYRWSDQKQQLIATDRWKLSGTIVDWAVVDETPVVIARYGQRYRLHTPEQSITLPRHITNLLITPCQCQTGQSELTLVVWQRNGRTTLSSYTAALAKQASKTIRVSGTITQLLAGHVTERKLDTAVLVMNDTAYLWQSKASGKFKRLPNIASVQRVGVVSDRLITASSTRPVQVGVYDYNTLLNEFDVEEVFYPYGETFAGGATLAVE